MSSYNVYVLSIIFEIYFQEVEIVNKNPRQWPVKFLTGKRRILFHFENQFCIAFRDESVNFLSEKKCIVL